MINSLPTIEQDDYTTVRSVNDQKIAQIFSQLFPDTVVPYEFVFDIVRLLEHTKINARLLPEVIRGIYNLTVSDRRGVVIVSVHRGKSSVQVRENSVAMDTISETIEDNIEK